MREQGTKHWTISDHKAVYMNRKKTKERHNVINTSGIDDVNECWNIIITKIRSIIDKPCPLRKINVKDNGDTYMVYIRAGWTNSHGPCQGQTN